MYTDNVLKMVSFANISYQTDLVCATARPQIRSENGVDENAELTNFQWLWTTVDVCATELNVLTFVTVVHFYYVSATFPLYNSQR